MKHAVTSPFNRMFLTISGLCMAVLIVATPYIISTISIKGFYIPSKYSYLIDFVLIAFLLLLYPALKWIIRTVRTWELSMSYLFFLPVFIHIFIAGLRLNLSTYILILYIVVYPLLVYLKKIDKIIITPLFYFIIVHFVIGNISLLGPHSISLLTTYSALLTLNIKLALVFLVLNSLITGNELKLFIRLFIVMCIFTSFVALAQLGIFYLTGVNYSYVIAGARKVVYSPFGVYPRVSGIFMHPIVMATNISVMFMMLLYSLLSPQFFSKRQRNIILALLGLMLIPLFLSTARGTWVAMAFGSIPIFFMKKPHLFIHKILLLLIVVFVSYITGLLNYGYDLLVSINKYSVDARYGVFALGLLAIKSNPILGYGLFNFQNYTGNIWKYAVHSTPFQVWSETGVLGLISYECIAVYVIWRVLKQLRKTLLPKNRFVLEAYFVALVTLIINGAFQTLAWASFTFIFFALGEVVVRIVKANEELGKELDLI